MAADALSRDVDASPPASPPAAAGLRAFWRADKLQLAHRARMRVVGAVWSLWARLVMRSYSGGAALSCMGWPVLTYRNGGISLGRDCILGRGVMKVVGGATLAIGDRVLINNGFVLSVDELVRIGDDVMLGENVSVRDADHRFDRLDAPMMAQGVATAPTIIENDVWIGRGVVILKGVAIGTGSIVGANSVVTRSVPPYTIVAGAPARKIRDRV